MGGPIGSCHRAGRAVRFAVSGVCLETGQSEPFTIAAEMGLVGLSAWVAFWVLCLRPMWTARSQAFSGQLARYQALGCGAVLLTSLDLDVMRFRFLWISLAVGLAAAVCARTEAAA